MTFYFDFSMESLVDANEFPMCLADDKAALLTFHKICLLKTFPLF